jgi:hypothetical protein
MPKFDFYPSFNAGEVSPMVDARTSLDKYRSACRTLENFVIMPYGGAIRRPGTQYIGTTKTSDTQSRLIGFNFSTTTRFVIELGVGYLRVWNPSGTLQTISGTATELATPYAAVDLREIQYCQINDIMYFAHANYPPRKLTRVSDTNWTFAEVKFEYPPLLDSSENQTKLYASMGIWGYNSANKYLKDASIIPPQWPHIETTKTALPNALAVLVDGVYSLVYGGSYTHTNNTLIIDGQTAYVGMLVHVTKESASENGVYIVTQLGTNLQPWILKETSAYNVNYTAGDFIYINHALTGVTQSRVYKCTASTTGPVFDATKWTEISSTYTFRALKDFTATTFKADIAAGNISSLPLASNEMGEFITQGTFPFSGYVGSQIELKWQNSNLYKQIEIVGNFESDILLVDGAWDFETSGTWGAMVQILRVPAEVLQAGVSVGLAYPVNTTTIEVYQPNHGYDLGDRVSFKGDYKQTNTAISSVTTNTYRYFISPATTLTGYRDVFPENLSQMEIVREYIVDNDKNIITSGTEDSLCGLKIVITNAQKIATTWSMSTPYKVGDFVYDSGKTYYCMLEHKAANDLYDNTKWKEITSDGEVPSFSATPAYANKLENWNSTDTYAYGDYVLQSGQTNTTGGLWQAKKAVPKNTPLYPNDYWEMMDTSHWLPSQAYLGGSYVKVQNTDKYFMARYDLPAANKIDTNKFTTQQVPNARIDSSTNIIGGVATITADSTINVDKWLGPLAATGAKTKFWQYGAFNATSGYPRSVCLHEQRLCFGGTKAQPNTIWCSAIGDFENFELGVNASDAVQFTLSASEGNRINWMFSQSEMLVGTSGDEWTIGAADSASALSATNVKTRRQASYGSKYMRAAMVNDVLLFVQRNGRKVRELVYELNKDGWVAPDLTLLAEHITVGEIVEVAYQQQPDAILWCVRGDGTLIGMTYERDQKVVGWHRHTIGDNADVESVATIYGNGTEDEVWMVVKRTVTGSTYRTIERFPLLWRTAFDDQTTTSYRYLDGHVAFASGAANRSVAGLYYLNGKTVTIVQNGVLTGTAIVSGGAVTVPQAAAGYVGLPYISTLTPMKLDMDLEDGSSQGRKKRIHKVVVRTLKSQGGEVRVNAGQWYDLASTLTTGDQKILTAGTFGFDADVSVQQSDPYPMCILAIEPVWDTYGNE